MQPSSRVKWRRTKARPSADWPKVSGSVLLLFYYYYYCFIIIYCFILFFLYRNLHKTKGPFTLAIFAAILAAILAAISRRFQVARVNYWRFRGDLNRQ